VAIPAYAEIGRPDPKLNEKLKSLARPTIGHWYSDKAKRS
jgi:hypothetical protein